MQRVSSICRSVFALVLLTMSAQALADLTSVTNALRTSGCERKNRAAPALREQATLNNAATRMARGSELASALRSGGYRAMLSNSIHIKASGGDEAVGRILRSRFCEQIGNPQFRDIGAARRGDDAWIILATPVPTAPKNATATGEQMLSLVNAARSRPQRCGRNHFEPAPPLKLVAALGQSARAHAQDMARHDTLNHHGSDDSTPAERLGRTGYKWRIVGENIASGRMTPDEVTAGWLKSPEHCENIMDPRFTDFGVGYAERREGKAGLYWVQVFAAPR